MSDERYWSESRQRYVGRMERINEISAMSAEEKRLFRDEVQARVDGLKWRVNVSREEIFEKIQPEMARIKAEFAGADKATRVEMSRRYRELEGALELEKGRYGDARQELQRAQDELKWVLNALGEGTATKAQAKQVALARGVASMIARGMPIMPHR